MKLARGYGTSILGYLDTIYSVISLILQHKGMCFTSEIACVPKYSILAYYHVNCVSTSHATAQLRTILVIFFGVSPCLPRLIDHQSTQARMRSRFSLCKYFISLSRDYVIHNNQPRDCYIDLPCGAPVSHLKSSCLQENA